MRTWLLAMGLVGCSGGGDLLGDDIGILNDGDKFTLEDSDPGTGEPSPDLGGIEITSGYQGAYTSECGDPDDPVMSEPMAAFGGPNQIEIIHQGVVDGLQPEWLIGGELDESTRTIRMIYEVTGSDISAETCAWTLEYVIHGVPTGEWTVEARGDSATATVTE